ncbi:MAG: urea ABC transporter permease subunit UrtB [Rhodospirillales bacterium]|nr:urea ABC transporter permease subunit UrtB [Rhodospirillales bacterium]
MPELKRLLPRFIAPLLVLAALVLGPAPGALAQSVGDTLAKFATDRFPDTARGVEEIARSGHPTALEIVEALGENRLAYSQADRSVYVIGKDDQVRSAETGAPVADIAPNQLRRVRINNPVRSAIAAALGALRLNSADPVQRRAAAEAIMQAHDADQAPALEAALGREKDARVATAISQALAALRIVDTKQPESVRLAAIDTLAERGDREALVMLRNVPAEAPAAIRQRAERAAAAVERRLSILGGVQNVFFGLSLGSVLLLAAIGLAITFGVMGIINMAHGEMVMLGAYTTFAVQEFLRTSAPGLFDWSLLFALPLAFLVAGGVGIGIERTIIRFLYGRPLETLLATWGVSLALQQAVRTIFGSSNREVGNPAFMTGSFDLFGISLTWSRMWIVVFTIAVFAFLLFVIRYTDYGLRMRAVVQNRAMAGSVGIRTNWIDALTFGLGSGIAGIAGVALSQIDNVSPNLGQGYIIDSFMVVVFGGVGSLWGTLVAALTLGIANKLLEPLAGAVLGKILILVFIILFIQKRPRGLFAQKGRTAES